MDKKTGIILGIIGAIVVVLVAVVFVLDSNTVKLDKNTLLVIEGNEYTIQEFEKYAKITNHSNGDINKKMNEEETTTMLDNFLLEKIYLDAAKKHDIKLESGDTSTINSDYEKDAQIFANAGISKEDYKAYREESALAQKLQYNLDSYYELPEEIYNQIRDSYKENDLYKTYGFRVMEIAYEAPKSGDENGDVVDILEEGLQSGDKEDKSRETKLKLAEEVLAKIKSGDDFKGLSQEYGTTRFTFSGTEYKLVNGDLEYTTSPLLESKLGNKDAYNAILKLNSGDVSEIIEDKEYTSFIILKLESVEDGFIGEGEKELKSVLLNEYANDIVAGNIHYELNQSAYIKTLYK